MWSMMPCILLGFPGPLEKKQSHNITDPLQWGLVSYLYNHTSFQAKPTLIEFVTKKLYFCLIHECPENSKCLLLRLEEKAFFLYIFQIVCWHGWHVIVDLVTWWLDSEIVRCSFVYRYGFRRPPHLELKARPKLGEREVTFAHVTDWIEKKLDQEFQVLPGSMNFPFLDVAEKCFMLLLWQTGSSG